MSKFIWLNGELVAEEKANLHLLSAALHYGAAVFEGLRSYHTSRGASIFRLREHAARLIDLAEILGFRGLPFTVEEVMQAIRDTLRANGLPECYIRPLLYLDGPVWSLNIDAGKASLMIAVWEWADYLGEDAIRSGVRANVSSFTRHHPNASMTKAKISGNYVNSILAKTESVRLGFEEAILLDPDGYVAECTGENLFLVRGRGSSRLPASRSWKGSRAPRWPRWPQTSDMKSRNAGSPAISFTQPMRSLSAERQPRWSASARSIFEPSGVAA